MGLMVSLDGCYDLHIHTNPCMIPRIADDQEVARAARAAGMAGIMLKCHIESTTSRAYLVGKELPGFGVYGGIVLNSFVGGLNPVAVKNALEQGARAVWMPTVDSRTHGEVHGVVGKYTVDGSDAEPAREGITFLDDRGEVKPEVRQILQLLGRSEAFLGTAHLNEREITAVVKAAREAGVKKIVINHADYKVPGLSLESMRKLVKEGAIIEFGYCTVSPFWHVNTVDREAEYIKALGAENCILVSDAGQRHNPMPHESLRILAQCLFEKGISEEELAVMMIENPRKLLGL